MGEHGLVYKAELQTVEYLLCSYFVCQTVLANFISVSALTNNRIRRNEVGKFMVMVFCLGHAVMLFMVICRAEGSRAENNISASEIIIENGLHRIVATSDHL